MYWKSFEKRKQVHANQSQAAAAYASSLLRNDQSKQWRRHQRWDTSRESEVTEVVIRIFLIKPLARKNYYAKLQSQSVNIDSSLTRSCPSWVCSVR